nr:hypothetical protein [Tanacetum cinerariifolium]
MKMKMIKVSVCEFDCGEGGGYSDGFRYNCVKECSEDINEGPSKGKVPKEDINEGPSKGKLAPLGSSARPRP